MVEFRKKKKPAAPGNRKTGVVRLPGQRSFRSFILPRGGLEVKPFFLSALPRERGRGGMISPPPWAGGWVPCAALAAPGRLADEKGGKGEWCGCRPGQVLFLHQKLYKIDCFVSLRRKPGAGMIQNALFCLVFAFLAQASAPPPGWYAAIPKSRGRDSESVRGPGPHAGASRRG